jgi:hypothetical protein
MIMKNLLILFSLFVCSVSAQNITDSLLLYYPMNGNANDLSGNSFHGTPSGVTSVPDRYGVPNSAYYFDGVNDYIDFPLNDTLKPEFPITFAFWAKLKVLSVYQNRFFNTDFVQNNYHGVWMNTNNSGYLGIGFGGGMFGCSPQNRVSYNATELALDTGIWYHLTGVINAANDMELYVNCNTVAAVYSSGASLTNIVYSNNISGTVGRADANNAPMYNWGYMDELSYWERALSAAEIYTLCDSLPLINSSDSWNCINGACVDQGIGNGVYVDSIACVNSCFPPSWDCIANACVDPGNGSGFYTSVTTCQAVCNATAINDVTAERKLIRIVDVLGRNTKKVSNVPLFYFYDDGSVEKQIIID